VFCNLYYNYIYIYIINLKTYILKTIKDLKNWIEKAEKKYGEDALLNLCINDSYNTPVSAELESMPTYISGITATNYTQANLSIYLKPIYDGDKFIKITQRK